jgi:hypothetical protein
MSSSTQKPKSGAVQEKTAQVAKGAAETKSEGHGEKPSRIDSKRRRTDKSIAMSKSSSSGMRESTATPTSGQATMTSSRHTPADSIDQAEKQELKPLAGERRVYQHNPKSHSSIGQDYFTVATTPTLYAKRGDNDLPLPRRKSSKRKAEDQARERELRATSSPIPIPKRPLSYSEGPLRRDTQKAPARLRKHADQHTSEVSLPVPESLSELGNTSAQNSFKVNALDVLSPRPTVRYSRNPRNIASRSQQFSRDSAREVIVEEDYSSKRRIEDLANGLDASALRELMERDQRRRERKRKTDQEKLEQKLKRTAEREKGRDAPRPDETRNEKEIDSAGPAFSGSRAPPNVPTDGRDRSADPFSDNNIIEPELPVPPGLRPGSSIYTRTSQASFSPPTSPTQRAFDRASPLQTSTLCRETAPDILDAAELSSGASEQSNAQIGSWTSFFRRGGNRGRLSSVDRGKYASGEFSNTSRDSISRTQPQTRMVGAPRTFRRSDTPQRTQSKFREDLPELPLSPPDSRVQSPEVGTEPIVATAPPDPFESTVDSSKLLANSSSGAMFDQTSKDDQLSQFPPNEPQTPPPAAALSQSLASVDSEASWLSGKPAKRSSVQRDHPLRQSQSSIQRHLVESDMGEEADVADDPYFSRLSPDHEARRRSSPHSALRKASSTALNIDRGSDSESEMRAPPLPETGNERWHSGLGRHPTLIRQAAQARSKEGLLKEYQSTDAESGIFEDEASDLESPDVDDKDLQAASSPIFRAQSVNFGSGHVRHISAGSAKLLDIRRSSSDSKRLSLPRGERSSTPIRGTATQEEE